MTQATIYEAIETILKAVLPQDCRIYHANIPLQVQDQLQRETMRLCSYLVFQDRVHVNSSGPTPVHEVIIEFSFYGNLTDASEMANDLTAMLVGDTVTSKGWRFCLYPAPGSGKRDVWEPRVAVKREWLQLKGFAIEPEE